MDTPYKRAADSPSRQLLWELNQLAVSSQEGFSAHLDRENDEREDLHKQALEAAAQRHDLVRQNAEIEKERLEAASLAQRRREENERRRLLEEEHQANELAEQRHKFERVRLAKEHAIMMAQMKKCQEDAERQHKAEKERQNDESNRVLQANADFDKRQQEEGKVEESLLAMTKPQMEKDAFSDCSLQQGRNLTVRKAEAISPSSKVAWQAEHARYVQIHQKLKELRKYITTKAKEQSELKVEVGNMRRTIKKSVGQLTGGNRRTPLNTIITTLRKALTFAEPQVDVTVFFARLPRTSPVQGPGLLIYLINEFSKAVVAQFVDEASANPKAADPVGTVASHIFALPDFRWQGSSLIDILLAKMHVVAPVIFGIYGPEDTVQGKTRLGWWREDGQSEGPFVPQQRHFERMTGLGSGFAAISLRNYEKAKVENPYPDRHYWEALAKVTNVPPSEMTQTHFVILKGLIENYESKFIGFYGGAALAALRLVLVELPSKVTSPSVASKSLAGLADILRKEARIIL